MNEDSNTEINNLRVNDLVITQRIHYRLNADIQRINSLYSEKLLESQKQLEREIEDIRNKYTQYTDSILDTKKATIEKYKEEANARIKEVLREIRGELSDLIR